MKKILLSTLMLGAVTLTLSAQNGTKEAPYSVDEYLALGIPDAAVLETYVEGYIVGYVEGATLSSGAHFDLTGSEISASNLLLASSSSETNVDLCIPVQLPSGDIRTALNLNAHPENLGHGVVLCGSREKYFGTLGLKSVSSYEWIGDAPVPTVTPVTPAETGTKENPLTVTEYLALGIPTSAVDNTWLTGVIVGSCTGMNIDSAEFSVTNASTTNILVAATAGVTSAEECIPVQLPAGDARAALNLSANPGNLGKTVVLCGSREKYFGVLGLKSVSEFTLSGEGSGETPATPAGVFYNGVATNSNADDWTLDEGTVPEGLNFVWTYDSKYGLKASAYYNDTRYATDIYAVSPVIDLTDATTAELTFQQALNYATDGADVVSVNVREENGAWAALNVEGMPEGNSWTFVDSKADLSAYVGKKIQLGMRYTSTDTVAATWEIKNVKVAGETSSNAVEAIAADAAVYVAGNDIVAPAGARAFNLQGIETGLNTLPAGIYVVVVADKAIKVLVK